MCCAVWQVRGLLWKLQAVFDLPRRLHSAIDNGAYEIAVRSYADAEPLLKRYGHKVCILRQAWGLKGASVCLDGGLGLSA